MKPWLVAVFLCLARVWGQDPFEIHVYEYEPLTWQEYSLETRLNFDPQGSDSRDGTLLPMHDQTHLSSNPPSACWIISRSGSWS